MAYVWAKNAISIHLATMKNCKTNHANMLVNEILENSHGGLQWKGNERLEKH